MIQFPLKDPAERLPLEFDFSAEAGASAINNVVFSVSVVSGTDATPSGVLLGPPVVTGGVVRQWVQGGVSGVTYRIRVVVTLADGRVLVLAAMLPVRDF